MPNLELEVAELTAKRDSLKLEIESFEKEIEESIVGMPAIKQLISSNTSKLNETIAELDESVNKIDSLNNLLYKLEEGKDKSKLELVKVAYQEIIECQNSIRDSLAEITNFEYSIFGDEEKKVIGIKQRIDEFEVSFKKKDIKWQENFETLFDRIEGLLPGATSTGLAKAYQDQRESYDKPYWLWSVVFVGTMIGMVIFAILTITEVKTVDEAFIRIVSRLPFFIPAFWLAIFASKQQSQNKRLQQEYAFKEALSKSYEADKREIEKLPESEERNQLSIKLLDAVIEMANNNPSETLHSAAHNDHPPSVLDLFKMKVMNKIIGKNDN